MQRKNKIILALAIGAMLLVIGSGVARCTFTSSEQEALDFNETIGNYQEIEEIEETEHESGKDEPIQADVQEGFANLKNTSWKSEDGKSTLSIIDGAFIEDTESGSSILYYTLIEEDVASDTLTATLAVASGLTEDEQTTVAIVRQTSNGIKEIVCDRLKSTYQMQILEIESLELRNVTEELFDTFGKSESEFENILIDYAKSKSPSTKSAKWDQEVWIDFGECTYLTNFTLDDAASTIVTIQMDASGELSVL